MMDWTDRHDRFFLRQISRHTRLYSEMVTTAALIHGDRDRLLRFDPAEHPVALQLGGAEPAELARCARFGEQAGYDEVNLNVGCPSDRVQSGAFGACLMAQPALVAGCVAAMSDAVSIPVTVKCRIGIDQLDDFDHLLNFVDHVAQGGCDTFIVHARKAWLQGLSPKENREVPPLCYERVYRLKQERPRLRIVINGGIQDLTQAQAHLERVDGVMIGRAAYHNPYLLAEADRLLFADEHAIPSRHQVLERLVPHVEAELAAGTPLYRMARHLLGLFQGRPGARRWRRMLSEQGPLAGADSRLLLEAARSVG